MGGGSGRSVGVKEQKKQMRRANGNSFRPPLTVTLVHDVYKPSLAFRDILMLSFCHRVPFFFFFFLSQGTFPYCGNGKPGVHFTINCLPVFPDKDATQGNDTARSSASLAVQRGYEHQYLGAFQQGQYEEQSYCLWVNQSVFVRAQRVENRFT